MITGEESRWEELLKYIITNNIRTREKVIELIELYIGDHPILRRLKHIKLESLPVKKVRKRKTKRHIIKLRKIKRVR